MMSKLATHTSKEVDSGTALRKRKRKNNSSPFDSSSDESPPMKRKSGKASLAPSKKQRGAISNQKAKAKANANVRLPAPSEADDDDDVEDSEVTCTEESSESSDDESEYHHAPKDVEYSDLWSESDEKRLREDWSDNDTIVLNATKNPEYALWRRCAKLLKISPLDLLPSSQFVNIDKNRPIKVRNMSDSIINTNWSGDFCIHMATAISLPAFKKDPDFFRYAVALAYYYRVGPDCAVKPDSLPIWTKRRDGFITTMNKKVRMTPEISKLMSEVFDDCVEPDYPRHFNFSKKLEAAVRSIKPPKSKGYTEPTGLIYQDFRAIAMAWDKYRKTSPWRLEKAAFYDRKMSLDRRRVLDQDVILHMKKEAILDIRRSEIISSRRLAASSDSSHTVGRSCSEDSDGDESC